MIDLPVPGLRLRILRLRGQHLEALLIWRVFERDGKLLREFWGSMDIPIEHGQAFVDAISTMAETEEGHARVDVYFRPTKPQEGDPACS